MIEYFKFEVKPFLYADRQKELDIKTVVDGVDYGWARVLSDQRSFENEMEYYTRLATESLKYKLRELEETK